MRFRFRVTDSTKHFSVVSLALVELQGKLLVLQDASSQHHGRWTLPGQESITHTSLSEDAETGLLKSTGLQAKASGLVGVYHTFDEDESNGLLIFAFAMAEPSGIVKPDPDKYLNAEWFSYRQLFDMPDVSMRYMHIRNMVKDYRKGKRYPLSLIHSF